MNEKDWKESQVHNAENSKSTILKAGAAGYFRKPVDDQALLDTIQCALSSQCSF